MQLDLDADPLALGPKRINQKTSECRGFLSRTERMYLEVSQDLYWYRREHRRALADFELAIQDLMTNDPEVRAGRNITDREAVAHTKLRTDRERISVLQFASEDLEAVLSVIRTKRNDLKNLAATYQRYQGILPPNSERYREIGEALRRVESAQP